MSGESEHFVRRWSRLKRTSADAGRRGPAPEAEVTAGPQAKKESPPPDRRQAVRPDTSSPPPKVDLSALPSIEAITAETDIRAFLQSGVPAELTKAALRRVWTADPAIRDFIEVAENQWDFTDPNAIPGFGSLDASANAGDVASHALRESSPSACLDDVAGSAPDTGDVEPQPPQTDTSVRGPGTPSGEKEAATTEIPGEGAHFVALQQDGGLADVGFARPNRRSHGRAVPR